MPLGSCCEWLTMQNEDCHGCTSPKLQWLQAGRGMRVAPAMAVPISRILTEDLQHRYRVCSTILGAGGPGAVARCKRIDCALNRLGRRQRPRAKMSSPKAAPPL